MTDSIRSKLLNFLSEPRSVEDVAKHLGVSASTADYHLQKAFEKDLILLWEWRKNASLKSQEKQKPSQAALYISRDSHLLPKGLTGFNVRRMLRISEMVQSRSNFVKFNSAALNKANFSSVTEKAPLLRNSENKSMAFPKIGRSKEKMIKSVQKRISMIRKPRSSQVRTLSVTERLSMLKALSCQSLSYLDLQARFNVSKRIIRTFIRNGFIKEAWGPRNIGVKLLLTEKGEKQLRQLNMATILERGKVRKGTIQLKYRSP